MLKKVIAMALTLCLLISSGTVANAATLSTAEDLSEVTITVGGQVYSLSELSYEIVDKDGNVVNSGPVLYSYPLASATVGVGQTVRWYPTGNTNGFKFGKYIAVIISLLTDVEATCTISLTNGTSIGTTEKNPNVALVSLTDGYGKLAVYNGGSSSFKVTGGTISWD
ncbi:hypothetical protein [Konateibacter massiliensis]|uniref:hypothetical protein n=1 Tax=Konateibacter massiliensis TaxID=2002841 RepID=UPI000C159AD2|nr:hypothetical protein [Konateibacter massiliensis]